MGRCRGRVVLAGIIVLAPACSSDDGGPAAFDPAQVYDVDFIGELVAADTSHWEQTQSAPTSAPFAATSGGPDSQLLVGPATLTLDDGTVINVDPLTPGGTFCPLLDLIRQPPDPPPGLNDREACVVIGMWKPGTTTAAWFATEVVGRRPDGGFAHEAAIRDGRAVVSAGWGAYFTVPILPDVTFDCGSMSRSDALAEPNSGYTVTLTRGHEVSEIACHYSM